MRKQHASKATLFFMELVIVIFFFSICAAVCVNIFGSAQKMASDSENLSKAVIEVRSAASCYKAAEGNAAQTALLLDGQVRNGAVRVYFDEMWKRTGDITQAVFAIQLNPRENPGEADVYALRLDTAVDNIIFSIPVKTHKEAV